MFQYDCEFVKADRGQMEEGEGNEALQMGSVSVAELWRSSDCHTMLSFLYECGSA